MTEPERIDEDRKRRRESEYDRRATELEAVESAPDEDAKRRVEIENHRADRLRSVQKEEAWRAAKTTWRASQISN